MISPSSVSSGLHSCTSNCTMLQCFACVRGHFNSANGLDSRGSERVCKEKNLPRHPHGVASRSKRHASVDRGTALGS